MNIDSTRNPDLVRLLARRILGESRPSEFIDWAVAKLVEGRDEMAINMLAGLSPVEEDEAYRYLIRAIDEMGLESLPDRDCLLEYAALLATKMLEDPISNDSSFACIWRINCHLPHRRELHHWRDLEIRLDEFEYAGWPDPATVTELYKETAARFLAVIRSWRRTGIFRLDTAESMRRLRDADLVAPSESPAAFADIFSKTLEGTNLEDLSLAHANICRSSLTNVGFENSDLTRAALCWNEFRDCSFSSAILFQADFRRSAFVRCRFDNANLANADFRGSTFENCSFRDAIFTGTLINQSGGFFSKLKRPKLGISKLQEAQIHWTLDSGPLPPGG